jgi:hypothetical protein
VPLNHRRTVLPGGSTWELSQLIFLSDCVPCTESPAWGEAPVGDPPACRVAGRQASLDLAVPAHRYDSTSRSPKEQLWEGPPVARACVACV